MTKRLLRKNTKHTKQAPNGEGSAPALPSPPSREELEKAGIKIVVALPMERNVTDIAFVHFWQIAKRGWTLIDTLYSRTDVGRNRMAHAFLTETDATHICFLDTDHLHPHDVVERLARWVLHDREKKVIGGLHFRRGVPYEPCAFVYGDDGKLHAGIEWDYGLIEVHAIGHGTLLVAREVFEKLTSPWWAYTYSGAAEDIYPSEDMYFSHQCREAGIKLWCDTTLTSPHLVYGTVTENTFRDYLADHNNEIKYLKPNHRREKDKAHEPVEA